MINVKDWDAVRKKYMDFWNHRMTGRAAMNIRCPAPAGMKSPFPEPLPVKSLYDRWENTDLILRNFLYGCGRTLYFAEGYPSKFVNMGPGFLAAMTGGTYKLAQDTVWFDNGPVVEDYDRDLDKVRMYTDSDAYRLILEMTRKCGETGQGRFITTITDLGGSLDVVASLRGNENLLFDIYDEPEGILALSERVDALWIEAYQTLYDILQQYQTGSDTWHGMYCEKKYYALQCDFCAMLSPDQFDKFVMPSLRRSADFLDYSNYHLDGPDCVRHLPSLLSIPNLDAIQWVPGDGAPDALDPCWYGMYRQIQDAGKSLIVLGLDAAGARKLLGELDQTKLFLNVSCGSEAEAESVIRFAEDHA